MDIKDKLLSNLSYVFCAFFGLFNFIFFAIPFMTSFASYNGETHTGDSLNGYECFGIFDDELGFGGAMTGITQILIFILCIAMLVLAVLAFLKIFDVTDVLPNEIGGIQTKKIAEYGVIGYAGLNALLLIFIIICCVSNTEEMWGVEYGIRISAGVFVTLILGIGAVVALYLLPKYININEGPAIVSVCTQCGQKTKSGVKFCPTCGGAVNEQVYYPTVYVCSRCNKKVKKGVAFCPDCGAPVTETVDMPKLYVCSQCGQSAKKGTAFCSACGGQIIEQVYEHSFYVCSQCNTQVAKGTAFCTKCGGAVIEKK